MWVVVVVGGGHAQRSGRAVIVLWHGRTTHCSVSMWLPCTPGCRPCQPWAGTDDGPRQQFAHAWRTSACRGPSSVPADHGWVADCACMYRDLGFVHAEGANWLQHYMPNNASGAALCVGMHVSHCRLASLGGAAPHPHGCPCG